MQCPICGFRGVARVETPRALFHRCGRCLFVFRDPAQRPTEDEAVRRYALHRNSPDDAGYVSFLSSIVDKAVAAAGPGVRRVVDWGSGPVAVGSRLLAARGFSVDSWDPHFNAAREPDTDAYDLALCVEVAEHFFDPAADFSALAARLRPGGVLALHTHFVPAEDGVFKSWWYKEDPTHVSFYSPAALERLARVSGLAVLAFESDRLAFFRRPLPVLVTGGANWDVEGRPFAPLIEGDSNPGSVRFFAGGTGRNIAEDLCLLSTEVEFISAVGEDDLGRRMIERCRAAGIGTDGMTPISGASTSSYLSILDDAGETALALSGMGVYESFGAGEALAAADRALSSARFRSFIPSGRTGEPPFSALVVDGNLLPEAIEALLSRFPSIPAWFDPVSERKARRVAEYRGGTLLSRFSAMKPNLGEAQALLGRPIGGSDVFLRAQEAAEALRARGAATIYISLGSAGVFQSSAELSIAFPAPVVRVVSSTGAGDAFIASLVQSSITGLFGEEALRRAAAVSSLVLGVEEASPPCLSLAAASRATDESR